MDIPKSTVKEPLKFFEWILDNSNFISYKNDFLRGYEIIPGVDIDYEKETVSYWSVADDGNGKIVDFTEVVYFKKDFSTYLNNGLNSFIQNFNEAIDERFLDNSHEKFIELLKIKIQEITESSKLISNNYPFVESYITQISEYIKKKQTAYSDKELITVTSPTPKEEDKTDDIYSIYKIFGFYKDRMSSEIEYNQLIEHITKFVETGNLPNEQQFQKIRHIQRIENGEIRYTFYVLWSENRKLIKQEKLCHFIKLLFDDFSQQKVTTIKSKLAERPPLDKEYIPIFIKNYDLNK